MMNRRFVLRSVLAVLAVVAIPTRLFAAWNKQAFDQKTSGESLKTLYDSDALIESDITLKVPEIAENGAAVPVEIETSMANVESIAIFADKNPRPLVAYFTFADNALAYVSTRIKLGQSSNVRAVAKTSDGKLYSAVQEVKVTIGGCGG